MAASAAILFYSAAPFGLFCRSSDHEAGVSSFDKAGMGKVFSGGCRIAAMTGAAAAIAAVMRLMANQA